MVAKYYLKHNSNLKTIWLVHSEKNKSISQDGTLEYAENLKSLLAREHNIISFPFVAVKDVSSSEEILRSLRDKLKLSKESIVHLNYTGGTKAMGTHAYRYIESLENLKKTSYSYLDGRNFRLIQDGLGTVNDNDLREEIKLSLIDLVALHSFERKKEEFAPTCEDALAEFKILIDDERLQDFYSSNGGYVRTFFEHKDKPNSLAVKLSHLNEELLSKFEPNESFYRVVKKMPEHFQVFNIDRKYQKLKCNDDYKKAIEFIDGKWLENYVYINLVKSFEDGVIDIQKNWKIQGRNWKSQNSDFEIDVLLMRGYQFIGISCTTSDVTSLCKSKGFEIVHRSRQMGGEEAKAILITRLEEEKSTKLDDELRLDTGGISPLMVIGADSLKEKILVKRITDFIYDRRYAML